MGSLSGSTWRNPPDRVGDPNPGKFLAGQLEEQEFELVRSKMEYDFEAFCVWREKCSDREASTYYRKLGYRAERYKKIEQMARGLVTRSAPQFRMCFGMFDKDSHATSQHVDEFVGMVLRRNQLESRDSVESRPEILILACPGLTGILYGGLSGHCLRVIV